MSGSILHQGGWRRRKALREVIERDGPTCWRCGRWVDVTLSGLAAEGPTLGHRHPVSLGGSDEPHNLGLEHRRCNRAAGARLEPPKARIARPIGRD